ncbi:branched-chain amino acid ABC transporter permease [Haloarchaeobius sp. HRN-SO-5]|uniref:branched-chain amino acid ABC transporter permease n=1 Tax=Haloarchaeobius sp. HRN-SO-5 TaxID=3446118 RepID=UPI003EB712BF
MTPLSIGLGDIATTLVNGVSYGMILVLVALGLSLVFGLMGVLNFAHGALFMLGGYVGLAVMKLAGGGLAGFGLALVVAPLVVAAIGAGLEKTVFKPLYETEPIYQLLLTFGLAVVIEEAVKYVWGAAPPGVPSRPPAFDGAVSLAGISLPYYRLFTILLGVGVVAGTALFLSRTRYGLIVRAGVYNTDRTATLGLNVERAFTAVFGLGSAIAALGGVVYIYRAIDPTVGSSIILPAFIVVIVGGLGSFWGSVIAGLLIGIVWQFSAVYAPIPAGTVTFLLMIGILLLRPQGILGEAEVEV